MDIANPRVVGDSITHQPVTPPPAWYVGEKCWRDLSDGLALEPMITPEPTRPAVPQGPGCGSAEALGILAGV